MAYELEISLCFSLPAQLQGFESEHGGTRTQALKYAFFIGKRNQFRLGFFANIQAKLLHKNACPIFLVEEKLSILLHLHDQFLSRKNCSCKRRLTIK